MICWNRLNPDAFYCHNRGKLKLSLVVVFARLMNVLIKFPIEIYQGLLGRCSVMSREYLVLKNGVVRHDEEENPNQPMVEILCEVERAKFLLDLATLVYPAAVPHIEKAMSHAHEE
jgi:hypothetical protein